MSIPPVQPGALELAGAGNGEIPSTIARPNLSGAEPWRISLAPGTELAHAAQVRWYAVYTCANHEKRVAQQLGLRGVEHFLPQYESVRRWKDRKVRLQLPLFPGYLFVQLVLKDRLRVLQVPGVVRLVGFNGSPTPMPEDDLHRIRECLGQGWKAEPYSYLQAGRRARVVRGPLAGFEGIVVRRKKRSRLVISFDLIQRSVAVEMDEENLAPA